MKPSLLAHRSPPRSARSSLTTTLSFRPTSEPGAKDEWGWYVEEPENSPPKTSLWRPFNGHNEF